MSDFTEVTERIRPEAADAIQQLADPIPTISRIRSTCEELGGQVWSALGDVMEQCVLNSHVGDIGILTDSTNSPDCSMCASLNLSDDAR